MLHRPVLAPDAHSHQLLYLQPCHWGHPDVTVLRALFLYIHPHPRLLALRCDPVPPGQLFASHFRAGECLHTGGHQCRQVHRDNVAVETKDYETVSAGL